LHIGSGIGRACAIGLAREGATGMLVADFNLDSAKGVLEECRAVAVTPNFNIEAVQIDVTQVQSVQEATDVMVQQFGRIDYVVHSAGVSCCLCSYLL
jgi:NAD(P)-dependent dehydrogenase (short-subunit alcohol dehydrogenase family)